MKKADIIENLKKEIIAEAKQANKAYDTKDLKENSRHCGKVEGLCFALSLYDFEIDRTEWQIKEGGLRRIAEIEIDKRLILFKG